MCLLLVALAIVLPPISGRISSESSNTKEEVINAEIGRKVHDLRTKAGLSQRELAKRVGASDSAICRLEDADYDGYSR